MIYLNLENNDERSVQMVTDKIRNNYNQMFDAEKKVADYILDHPVKVLEMNISELARNSGTSDATIIRMCKHIGYTGFQQMKINLASESGTKQFVKIPNGATPTDVVSFFSQVADNITDSAKNVNFETLKKIVDLLVQSNITYFFAWGNSGAIASDMAHRIGRFGIKSFYSEDIEYSLRNINLGNSNDLLVAISHSGTTTPVIQAIKIAKSRGMITVLLTEDIGSRASELADYVLLTSVKNKLFYDLGGVSHIIEYAIVDAILYFLKDKKHEVADEAEILLSEYKM